MLLQLSARQLLSASVAGAFQYFDVPDGRVFYGDAWLGWNFQLLPSLGIGLYATESHYRAAAFATDEMWFTGAASQLRWQLLSSLYLDAGYMFAWRGFPQREDVANSSDFQRDLIHRPYPGLRSADLSSAAGDTRLGAQWALQSADSNAPGLRNDLHQLTFWARHSAPRVRGTVEL